MFFCLSLSYQPTPLSPFSCLSLYSPSLPPFLPTNSLHCHLQQRYYGQEGNSYMTFLFSLSCIANYYGSNCATHCVARDNSGGHYSCDSVTGVRICLEGWSDPSNNCLTREFSASTGPVVTDNCVHLSNLCSSMSTYDPWNIVYIMYGEMFTFTQGYIYTAMKLKTTKKLQMYWGSASV